MSDIHVFTSAAANYLPRVRVLFDTLRQHHPEWQRHLLLVEEPVLGAAGFEDADEVHTLDALGIPDWKPWSFCHSLVELATAAKPFLLAKLLERDGCRAVIYLDPDIAVFSRLDDIVEAMNDLSILLSPHQLLPEGQLARVVDNEISSLRHGVFNLGFIAVANDPVGGAFAEWWSQRLYHFCRDAPELGLFTDQRWIDLVPAFFPGVGVLRSTRHNVAPWNLSRRSLVKRAGQYLVDGEPLGFYHFTAAGSDSHEMMTIKNSDNPGAVRELLDWYRQAGVADPADAPVRWSLGVYDDGSVIEPEHREAYRDEPSLQRRFPDPYRSDGLVRHLRSIAAEPAQSKVAANPLQRISLGYTRGAQSLDADKLQRLLAALVRQPALAGRLFSRLVSVVSTEGVSGVVKRLR